MGTQTYPVNLVKVIGLHHKSADNTGTVGTAELGFHSSEEDVEISLDSGSISLLLDLEFGTQGGAVDRASSRGPLVKRRRSDGEISAERPLVETSIGGTGFCCDDQLAIGSDSSSSH